MANTWIGQWEILWPEWLIILALVASWAGAAGLFDLLGWWHWVRRTYRERKVMADIKAHRKVVREQELREFVAVNIRRYED